MVQISLQNSGGKVFFLGGSMEPPWALTGVKVPWSLSVNVGQVTYFPWADDNR